MYLLRQSTYLLTYYLFVLNEYVKATFSFFFEEKVNEQDRIVFFFKIEMCTCLDFLNERLLVCLCYMPDTCNLFVVQNIKS